MTSHFRKRADEVSAALEQVEKQIAVIRRQVEENAKQDDLLLQMVSAWAKLSKSERERFCVEKGLVLVKAHKGKAAK